MARVLVVDDDQQVRSMLRLVLQRAGHEVAESVNGDDALLHHSRQPADLIITDLIMPKREGLETIMEIRRIDQTVKIIAISGGDRRRNIDSLGPARALGANAAIAKPFSPSEILQTVRNLLEEN